MQGIEVVSYKRFPKPIRVLIRSSQEFIIATAWDAVEFLRNWPAARDGAYRRALQHCLDALDGITSQNKAQAAFADAARQAGILA
jgi:hypothetical protein